MGAEPNFNFFVAARGLYWAQSLKFVAKENLEKVSTKSLFLSFSLNYLDGTILHCTRSAKKSEQSNGDYQQLSSNTIGYVEPRGIKQGSGSGNLKKCVMNMMNCQLLPQFPTNGPQTTFAPCPEQTLSAHQNCSSLNTSKLNLMFLASKFSQLLFGNITLSGATPTPPPRQKYVTYMLTL